MVRGDKPERGMIPDDLLGKKKREENKIGPYSWKQYDMGKGKRLVEKGENRLSGGSPPKRGTQSQ